MTSRRAFLLALGAGAVTACTRQSASPPTVPAGPPGGGPSNTDLSTLAASVEMERHVAFAAGIHYHRAVRAVIHQQVAVLLEGADGESLDFHR